MYSSASSLDPDTYWSLFCMCSNCTSLAIACPSCSLRFLNSPSITASRDCNESTSLLLISNSALVVLYKSVLNFTSSVFYAPSSCKYNSSSFLSASKRLYLASKEAYSAVFCSTYPYSENNLSYNSSILDVSSLT